MYAKNVFLIAYTKKSTMLHFRVLIIRSVRVVCKLHCNGGSVVKWVRAADLNPEVLGSRPALTTSWSCFSVAPSSTPQPRLSASCQLGILTMLFPIYTISL